MIAIAIPTNRGFKPQTVQSLLEMIAHLNMEYKFIIPTSGYNTAENRNYIVAQAIKSGCSHILFMDDDMIYPSDLLLKLLTHDKDIVGGMYSVRKLSGELVIEYLEGNDEWAKSQTELFTCKALGGGALLVKTDVFRNIPQPFFGYKWYDNGMVEMSNDWFFCEKARESGYEIWCDPTLKIKHIGDYEF